MMRASHGRAPKRTNTKLLGTRIAGAEQPQSAAIRLPANLLPILIATGSTSIHAPSLLAVARTLQRGHQTDQCHGLDSCLLAVSSYDRR
jgi:hypothetical protein